MVVDLINIPFIALLLQGIPEQIAVVTLASVIARIPLNWKKMIPMGIFLALLVYIARLLPAPFGLHTLILIIVLFGYLLYHNRDLSLSLIASLVSFFALTIFEVSFLSVFMRCFHITKETIFGDPAVRILVGMPQVILIFFTALVISKVRKRGSTHD